MKIQFSNWCVTAVLLDSDQHFASFLVRHLVIFATLHIWLLLLELFQHHCCPSSFQSHLLLWRPGSGPRLHFHTPLKRNKLHEQSLFFPPHKAVVMSLFCRRWNVGVQFCPEAHYQLGLILPRHKGWQNVMLTCRLLHLSAVAWLSVRLMYDPCAHIISWRIVSAYSLFVLWLSKLQDVEAVLARLQLSCLDSVMCNVTMAVLSRSCLWALFIRLSLGHTDTTQSLNAVLCIFIWGWRVVFIFTIANKLNSVALSLVPDLWISAYISDYFSSPVMRSGVGGGGFQDLGNQQSQSGFCG